MRVRSAPNSQAHLVFDATAGEWLFNSTTFPVGEPMGFDFQTNSTV